MPKARTAPAAKPPVVTPPPKSPWDVPQELRYKKRTTYEFMGQKSFSVQQAMDYLGWTQLGDVKGRMLQDVKGNSIQLYNNRGNRPIDEGWVKTLAQIILNKQWEMNWQPILISKYGNVVSGQHRMIALVFAEQMRTDPKQAAHWKEVGWTKPVTIDVLLIEGTEEGGNFTRTVDYTRPRSDSDILYCDRDFFTKNQGSKERELLCRVAGNAIRFLWDRTGRNKATYSSKFTPTELVDWFRSHPSLEDVVKTVESNNTASKGNLAYFLPLGKMSAMTYLMAASTSDPDAYDHTEKSLALDQKLSTGDTGRKGEIFETVLERACGFINNINSKTDRTIALERWIEKRHQEAVAAGVTTGITEDEKLCAVAKAWNRFLHLQSSEKLTVGEVKLKYVLDDGKLHLEEHPRVSGGEGMGIDFGGSKQRDDLTSTNPEPEVGDPDPDDLAAAAAKVKDKHAEANGGAVHDDESPAAEKARREAIEGKVATNGTAAKPPAAKPKPPSPAQATQNAVNPRIAPKKPAIPA